MDRYVMLTAALVAISIVGVTPSRAGEAAPTTPEGPILLAQSAPATEGTAVGDAAGGDAAGGTGVVGDAAEGNAADGLPPPLNQPDQPPLNYFVAENGQPVGPLNCAELEARANSGALTAGTMVWTEGMADWAQAATRPDLMPLVQSGATPGFDAARYLQGQWQVAGQLQIPGLGAALLSGTETYTADGNYQMRAQLSFPDPQAAQIPGQPAPQRSMIFTAVGTFKVVSGGPQQITIEQSVTSTYTDPLGQFPQHSEQSTEPNVLTVLDQNRYSQENGAFVSRRMN